MKKAFVQPIEPVAEAPKELRKLSAHPAVDWDRSLTRWHLMMYWYYLSMKPSVLLPWS